MQSPNVKDPRQRTVGSHPCGCPPSRHFHNLLPQGLAGASSMLAAGVMPCSVLRILCHSSKKDFSPCGLPPVGGFEADRPSLALPFWGGYFPFSHPEGLPDNMGGACVVPALSRYSEAGAAQGWRCCKVKSKNSGLANLGSDPRMAT